MDLRNKIRKVLSEIESEKEKISYSAVVLDEQSRKKIISILKDIIPSDWKVFAHHLTICMGELPEDLKPFLGHSANLYVTGIGMSDKALAIRVEGFESDRKIPHITIAVNVNEGGKPKDSNFIPTWNDFGGDINLWGHIEEIPFPPKDIEQIDEKKKR